ncbi:MAG: hypothetical protein IPO50_10755 [Sphingomonadales bacterium]|nr:hypothetical protein [Sphingomonadales bacterium]
MTDSADILITTILSKEKPDCVANDKHSVAHALQSFEAADDLERTHMKAKVYSRPCNRSVGCITKRVGAAKKRIGGAGGESCTSFLNRSGKDGLSDTAALQWALGYLTGRSVATDKIHRAFEGPEGIAKRSMFTAMRLLIIKLKTPLAAISTDSASTHIGHPGRYACHLLPKIRMSASNRRAMPINQTGRTLSR